MKKMLFLTAFLVVSLALMAQMDPASAQRKIIELETEVQGLKAQLHSVKATDVKTELPEKMGRYEFKRRTRAQQFKVNEALAQQAIRQTEGEALLYDYGDPLVSQDLPGYGLPGLLINNKRGLGENVTFRITRRGFKEFPAQIYNLAPEERLWVKLPAGEYLIEVSMGSRFMGYVVCKVDPANIKYADGQKCYFWAEKTLADF
jgi:hypothetical protein